VPFQVNKIREDFPILKEKVYGNPLVYLDNGATSQKPLSVIELINQVYSHKNSSIHRGVHYLSEQATEMYEDARRKIQQFIHADLSQEVIFTSGATGSINAVAFSFGEQYIKAGDEVIISEMEHHANIVPWQMMCERKKAKLRVIPFDDKGELRLDEYSKLFSPGTKIVAVTHVSNSLGTINPVKEIIDIAHSHGVPVLLDGAQAIQHLDVDVQELDCDFYAFSGHKIYGPTGIGVLYGKQKYLYEMPPYQGGGDMVDCVRFEHTTYNDLPFKFEAGTTNFVGAFGLGAAIDYLQSVGLKDIAGYENELRDYALQKLLAVHGLRIYGMAENRIGIFSFRLEGIHPYDAGMLLDKMGFAVRTGTHCNQPVMDHFEVEGTIRASLAFYNLKEEIDKLCIALEKVKKMLG
jgi:cysteine desulfurase / selenocysteine lyase